MASASTTKQRRLIKSAAAMDDKRLKNLGTAALLSIERINPEALGDRAGEGRTLKKKVARILADRRKKKPTS